MQKTILITGATDGIGLETAAMLYSQGHHLLLHGRNPAKLEHLEKLLAESGTNGRVDSYVADLLDPSAVEALAREVIARHAKLDILINNAGVYKTVTGDGLDPRFLVNTIAPYVLTTRLLPLLETGGRIINVSSAAQAPVDLQALAGHVKLSAGEAYAQSKLALTMWSRDLALSLKGDGPMVVAVNPGSLLATKMVKEAFGMAGGDVRKGADILTRAALSDEFADASGKYFDNDSGAFAPPHPHSLDARKCREITRALERVSQDTSQ